MGTFSNNGYVRERLDEWRQKIVNIYKSILGENIDLSDDTQDGQLTGSLAEAYSNQDQQVELIAKVCDPNQAQGSYLSTLVVINGIERNGSTSSTATLSLTGTDGTVIAAGSQVREDQNNEVFTTDNAVTIASGVATVTASALNSGAIVATSGTITIIDSQIAGWESVTNSNDANVGQAEESDEDLRVRRKNSVAIASTGNVDSVLGAVSALDDVDSAVVKENFTGTTDSDGITAHSIAVIVEGGDATEIAETILNTKSAGCDTFGSLTETVTDSQGFDVDVDYSRPDDQNVYIAMEIRPLADYPTDGDDQIKANIIDYFEEDSETRLVIGDDVIFSEIYNPINDVTGTSVPSLSVAVSAVAIDPWLIGTTYAADDLVTGSDDLIYVSLTSSNTGNDPTTDCVNWTISNDDIEIDFDEFARFDTSRITITQVA